MYLADLCCSLNVFLTNSWLNLTKNSSCMGLSVFLGVFMFYEVKKIVEGKSDEPQNLNIPEIQFIDSGILVAL